MANESRRVYRVEAIRRYSESRERSVLPRMLTPPAFAVLWLLIGLVAAAAVVVWTARVPEYGSGPAALIDWKGRSPALPSGVAAVVVLRPDQLTRVRVGQPVTVTVGSDGERLAGSVVEVAPTSMGPDQARERYQLPSSATEGITGPSAIAIARVDSFPAESTPSHYLGSTGTAKVEFRSRRVASLLPVVGHLLEG